MAHLSAVSATSLQTHVSGDTLRVWRSERTVVSGLTGRFSCIGVPPSLTIFAFFLCKRRSWFFFILAISSSSLPSTIMKSGTTRSGNSVTHLFLARLSFSASPVGARASAVVFSSSIICRFFTYALMTAASRMISVRQSPFTCTNCNETRFYNVVHVNTTYQSPYSEHPTLIRSYTALTVTSERRSAAESWRSRNRGLGHQHRRIQGTEARSMVQNRLSPCCPLLSLMPLFVLRCQLGLVLPTERVKLGFPNALDLGLVDYLLLGDVVSMCGLWSVLCFS